MPSEAGTRTLAQRLRSGHVAAASAVAVLVANASGLAVGDDGVGYQAIADRLAAGRGYGYFLEDPVTIWPPGWPAAMAAVATVTPLDTKAAAGVLNAATAAVVVLLIGALLRRLVVEPLVRTVTLLVAGLGASSMVFGHLLMTDFAFAAVTLGLFLVLARSRDTDAELPWVLGAASLVWLGFAIRYAGVIHLATGGLWLLVDPDRPLVRRVRNAALFGIVGVAAPAAWILRNRSVDGTALGVRYSSTRGLVANAADTVATIGSFLLPGVAIETRTVWLAVAVVGVGVVAAMTWRVLRRADATAPAALGQGLATLPGLLLLHVGIYAAYMLYARTTTGLNRLDFRLLNPLYLPLVLGAAVVVDRLRRDAAADPGGERWRRLATGSLLAWGSLNVAVGVAMVGYFATGPDLFVGNYERAAFEEVRASPVLDELPPGCRGDRLSSNLPNALYDRDPPVEAEWSPRLTGLESNDPVDDLDRLVRDVERAPECLVWIDLEPRYGHLASLDQLRAVVDVDRIASDGPLSVYELSPRS